MKISSIAKQTGTAVGRVAEDLFRGAVEDFTRGTLGGPSTTAPGAPRRTVPLNEWVASSYAAALAGTNYRPKLKFLFKIQFIFKESILQAMEQQGLIDAERARRIRGNEFTFMVKTVDRPKIDFEYEDEVNRYNFRTKVLKRIRHRELTVTFMDDTGNRVFDFFRLVMMAYSPITRRQLLRDGSIDAVPDALSADLGSGMEFSGAATNLNDIAHRGALGTLGGSTTDLTTLISTIRIKQIFIDPQGGGENNRLAGATKAVSFDFMNPRVVSFDLDDMSHETSDPNLLTMQFDYDWMEMVDGGSLQGPTLPEQSAVGQGIDAAPADISVIPGGSTAGGPSAGRILGSTVRNVLGRAAGQLTAEAVNRTVQTIAGGGAIGRIVGSAVGNATGGAIGGIVSSGVGNALGGIVSGARFDLSIGAGTQAGARASSSPVIDGARGGGQASASIVAASSSFWKKNPGIS